MEELIIRLDESTQTMIKRIDRKLGYRFNRDEISIDELLNTLSDLEDEYDDLQNEFDDYKEYVNENYQSKTSYTYDEDLGAFRGE